METWVGKGRRKGGDVTHRTPHGGKQTTALGSVCSWRDRAVEAEVARTLHRGRGDGSDRVSAVVKAAQAEGRKR